MAKPITIPNTFASATSAIPLSQLDQDFSTLANATNDLATYSNYVADTGAADAYIANYPANTNTGSLTTGLRLQFKASNANTGASTLNVQVNGGSIGTAAIRLTDGSALPANTIIAGALVDVMYDGTNFQIMNDPSGGQEIITNLTLSGNLTVAGTSTFTGNVTGNVVNTTTSTITNLTSGNVTITGGSIDNISITNLTSLTVDGDTTIGDASGDTLTINGTTVTTPNGLNFDSNTFVIDATNNRVGIGTSSPIQLLTVESTSNVRATIRNSTENTSYSSSLDFATGSGSLASTNVVGRIIGLITQADPSALQSALTFHTNAGDAIGERLRIDSGGNVIQAGGSYFLGNGGGFGWGDLTTYIGGTSASDFINFHTNGTERMRIDSSGNVGIGVTPSYKFHIKGSGSTSSTLSMYVQNSANTELFFIRDDGAIETGEASLSPYNNTTASAANMLVDSTGRLYRSTSSLKYKTDVQDAKHGLAEVLKLRPVTYKGKTDGDTVFGGLIAEEVHDAGLTEFVQYAKDGSPDALAYGQMVSLAFKAIQEQQAMIEELKAEVALLKSK